jgi:hypothetical protein
VITPAQIMQMKMQQVCAHGDANLDGKISKREFDRLHKSETGFWSSDTDMDGLLSLRECVKATAIS